MESVAVSEPRVQGGLPGGRSAPSGKQYKLAGQWRGSGRLTLSNQEGMTVQYHLCRHRREDEAHQVQEVHTGRLWSDNRPDWIVPVVGRRCVLSCTRGVFLISVVDTLGHFVEEPLNPAE